MHLTEEEVIKSEQNLSPDSSPLISVHKDKVLKIEDDSNEEDKYAEPSDINFSICQERKDSLRTKVIESQPHTTEADQVASTSKTDAESL